MRFKLTNQRKAKLLHVAEWLLASVMLFAFCLLLAEGLIMGN